MKTTRAQDFKRKFRRPVGMALCALPLATAARRLPPGRAKSLSRLALNRRVSIITVRYDSQPTEFGFAMSGDTSDLIQRYIYVFGVWEPNLSAWMDENLSEGEVVLDVGANVGYFSLLAAKKVGPSGRVISFEPAPEFVAAVERNARLNAYTNIDIHPVAASDAQGEIDLYVAHGSNLGMTTTEEIAGYTSKVTVKCVRVADQVDAALWPRIRLVKVDVEGDELRALRGMEEILRALSPGAAVATEVAPDRLAARGQTAEEAMSFMRDLGFIAYAIPNEYVASHYLQHARSEFAEIAGDLAEQGDVLFVKKG